VFKKIFTAAWMVLLFVCCQLAAAATSLSVTATPSNPSAPATVTLSVSVITDTDPVTITQVEYFSGSTSLGFALNAPFELSVTDLAAGSYQIVAKASTTNPDSPTLQSTPLTVTVSAPQGGASAYFIHTDQLNTPRAITDTGGALAWTWDSDPFGKDAASEQPSGQSPLNFAPRFAGQQLDKETNLHQNYFRDYDPSMGR
jgi:predicted secreted protein